MIVLHYKIAGSIARLLAALPDSCYHFQRAKSSARYLLKVPDIKQFSHLTYLPHPLPIWHCYQVSINAASYLAMAQAIGKCYHNQFSDNYDIN